MDGEGVGEPPQFVGKTRTVEFPLIRGQSSVQVSSCSFTLSEIKRESELFSLICGAGQCKD